MSESPTFQLSNHTVSELEEIDGITAEIIEGIREICELLYAGRNPPAQSIPPGKRRLELEPLSKTLARLAKIRREISVDSYIDVKRRIESETPTNAMTVPLETIPTIDIFQFFQDADQLADIVTRTTSTMIAKQGNTRLDKPHLLAELIGLRMKISGLSITQAPTGTYMTVLEIVFDELHPTEKGVAHLRYGRKAIKRINDIRDEQPPP